MRYILLFVMAFGIAKMLGAEESAQSKEATRLLNQCRSRGETCKVTYTETTVGWLWKDGRPVNNETTVIVRKTAPPKRQPTMVYPPVGQVWPVVVQTR